MKWHTCVSRSVRLSIRIGFGGAGLMFLLAAALAVAQISGSAYLAAACLFFGTLFLVLLDIAGGLPFLMSVKPSERTEMAAVYSTFRDVSAVLTPASARIILLFGPVAAVFAACSVGLIACWAVAGLLHPRLGRKRRAA